MLQSLELRQPTSLSVPEVVAMRVALKVVLKEAQKEALKEAPKEELKVVLKEVLSPLHQTSLLSKRKCSATRI